MPESVIIRTYRGSRNSALRQFSTDAAVLAGSGYVPKSQVWIPGTWGCGAFLIAVLLCLLLIGILIFIYMLIVKPNGTLTVTYELKPPTPAER